MSVFVETLARPAERSLQRIRVGHPELLMHHDLNTSQKPLIKTYPTSCFFALLYREVALLEWKPVHLLLHEHRQDLLLMLNTFLIFLGQYQSLSILTPVQEQILLPWVSMYVHKQEHFSALEGFLYHFLHSVDLCRLLRCRVQPLSVQVKPRQWTSIVANDDTIRIQHWNYLENERFS